jgi:putative tricarboxylic transport membrane protein
LVHGLVPGPMLFQDSGEFVAAFMVLAVATTVLHLVIGRAGLPLFIQAVRLPTQVLFPIVILLCFTGVFVANNSLFDVYVMLGFGVLGYAMSKFGFPVAPLLIGFILGPIVEIGLRQSLVISRGSLDIFVTKPISALFLSLALATLVWVGWREWRAGHPAPRR